MGNNYMLEIKNMQFWGKHGYYEEETKRGQKFFIDVQASYDMLQMCKTDQLDKGINYIELYKTCKEVVEDEQYKLLQKLAYRIIEKSYDRFALLSWIKVTVKKPFVPVEGIVDYISIVIEKSAEEFRIENA
ncbi:MAG: dihydroneopterin aldolase [Clostridia bacterium]